MVGGLKIVQVKQGHEAELERLFAELRAEMRTHEPGCLLYSLLKSRAKPGASLCMNSIATRPRWKPIKNRRTGQNIFR